MPKLALDRPGLMHQNQLQDRLDANEYGLLRSNPLLGILKGFDLWIVDTFLTNAIQHDFRKESGKVYTLDLSFIFIAVFDQCGPHYAIWSMRGVCVNK
jgi:hypothetical protein